MKIPQLLFLVCFVLFAACSSANKPAQNEKTEFHALVEKHQKAR